MWKNTHFLLLLLLKHRRVSWHFMFSLFFFVILLAIKCCIIFYHLLQPSANRTLYMMVEYGLFLLLLFKPNSLLKIAYMFTLLKFIFLIYRNWTKNITTTNKMRKNLGHEGFFCVFFFFLFLPASCCNLRCNLRSVHFSFIT